MSWSAMAFLKRTLILSIALLKSTNPFSPMMLVSKDWFFSRCCSNKFEITTMHCSGSVSTSIPRRAIIASSEELVVDSFLGRDEQLFRITAILKDKKRARIADCRVFIQFLNMAQSPLPRELYPQEAQEALLLLYPPEFQLA
ncbi:MAG: hypothetical protein BWX81_01807 [Spirochaetes bacterium ADurb.Bin110]|nr:MAG: hypothetical protein BWX81_01807 [Spirochaetes bacterium ADurb.Bin110]